MNQNNTHISKDERVISKEEIIAMTNESFGVEEDLQKTSAFWIIGAIFMAIGLAFIVFRNITDLAAVDDRANTWVKTFINFYFLGLVLLAVARRKEEFVTKRTRINACYYAAIFTLALNCFPMESLTAALKFPMFQALAIEFLLFFCIAFYAEMYDWISKTRKFLTGKGNK